MGTHPERGRSLVGLSALLMLVAASCDREPVPSTAPGPLPLASSARPTSTAPTASASAPTTLPSAAPSSAPATPAGPATVERIEVPGDRPAAIVRALAGSTLRTLFLPGLCSNAVGYLHAFPEAARAAGGVLAIDGDRPCGADDSGFRSFTWSHELQRKRFEAALAAASLPTPEGGFTLVGYSSGASIGERMHAAWPELFPRLVLIAPPKDPAVTPLRGARGVVTMACSLDVTSRMKMATAALTRLGVPSIYLEMPGCSHGNIAEGDRVFGEAFSWLAALDARRAAVDAGPQ